jgi:hypothetical protein
VPPEKGCDNGDCVSVGVVVPISGSGVEDESGLSGVDIVSDSTVLGTTVGSVLVFGGDDGTVVTLSISGGVVLGASG